MNKSLHPWKCTVACLLLFSFLFHSCKKDDNGTGLPTLSVEKDRVNFTYEGGSATINISSNTEWTIDCPDQWWVSQTEGRGDAEIIVTAQQNPLTKSYSGILTITSQGIQPVKVTLAQLGSDPDLLASPGVVSLSSGSDTFSIEVTTNVTYQYSISETWITVISDENNVLQIAAAENTSTTERTAEIVFSGDEGLTDRIVTVTQEGVSARLSIVGEQTRVVDFDEQSLTIIIESTGNCDLTLIDADDWLSLSDQPVAEGIRYTYTFALTTNSGASQRKASVIFKQQQHPDLADTVTVLQNGSKPVPEITILDMPEGGFVSDTRQWIRVRTEVKNAENAIYRWTLNGEEIHKEKDLLHVMKTPGNYTFILNVKNDFGESNIEVPVAIRQKTYENNLTKVFDYLPAPGQFVNQAPSGNSQTEVNDNALSRMRNKGYITLGGLGGYVVMGFDHVIMNTVEEYDFLVFGNAFSGWAEPAMIMVAFDANGNGLPDDEWYEIAGSEYNNPKAVRNYSITYQPENAGQEIHWSDNQGKSGIIYRNGFHDQSYFPVWKHENITFSGITSLTDAFVTGDDGIVTTNAFAYGYVDNCANNLECAKTKLDWAVDKNGNPMTLKGIDFIKVYNPINAVLRAVGEVSPEVAGFEEYNLD